METRETKREQGAANVEWEWNSQRGQEWEESDLVAFWVRAEWLEGA